MLTLEELHARLTEILTERPELRQSCIVTGHPSGRHGFDVVDLHITRDMRKIVLGTDGMPYYFEDAIC